MNDSAARYDRASALTLPGGWRMIVAPRPRSTTVALQWMVDAGSRRDGSRPGVARLTAELVFRAASADRADPVLAVERLGGEATATTTREYAGFQAVVAAPQRAALLALIPLLARSPQLAAEALDRARAAIVQEQRARASPSNLLGELLIAALWGDTAFARPTIPPAATLTALTPEAVAAYHAAHYRPGGTVLAVAGACDVAEVSAALAALPSAAPGDEASPAPLAPPAFVGRGAFHHRAATDLAYVAVALPVPGMAHPDRSALRLLDYVVGRGGSSRLYRELRERHGLVYTVGSVYMPFADVGLFGAQARCAPERTREVATLLADGLLALASQPPSAAELRAAQERYAGALYRSFEPNATLASLLAVETLLARWEPFESAVARVLAVTPAELAAVARRYCTAERLVQVSVGPLDPRAPG